MARTSPIRSQHLVLTILGLLAILGLTILSSGCFYQYRAKASRTDTIGYSLKNDGLVDLTTFNGRIEVRKYEKPGVWLERTTTCRSRTEEEALEGLDLIDPDVVTSEDKLSVKVTNPRSRRHQFQVDFIALVPEQAGLVLNTSNGQIQVEGIQGNLSAHTSNGAVTARDSGKEKVNIRTSNGKILAERLSGDLDIHTSNGRVEILGCPGEIKVRTSNGSVAIDLEGESVSRDIVAETSNGGVRCRLPGSYSGEVNARTSNGSVRCEFPITVEAGKIGKRHLQGRIGEGGPSLSLKTSNGSISIQRGSTPPEKLD